MSVNGVKTEEIKQKLFEVIALIRQILELVNKETLDNTQKINFEKPKNKLDAIEKILKISKKIHHKELENYVKEIRSCKDKAVIMFTGEKNSGSQNLDKEKQTKLNNNTTKVVKNLDYLEDQVNKEKAKEKKKSKTSKVV